MSKKTTKPYKMPTTSSLLQSGLRRWSVPEHGMSGWTKGDPKAMAEMHRKQCEKFLEDTDLHRELNKSRIRGARAVKGS